MILAIVLVQVSFMILSMISSPKVFNVCHHVADECPKRAAMVRFVGFMLGPVAPIIIFGNYIFNREQEYAFKRELQTQGNLEYDLGNNEEEEMAQMDEEAKVDPDDDPTKVSLFRKILKFRYRAALSKRYYSYYRIIQATVESIVVLDVLTLILIVTSKPGRIGSDGELLEKNGRTFMAIVSEKLAEFLGFISSQGLIETLGISSTLAFYLALTYSLLMIITAIARYVYQNKNSNMSLKGQVCYGLSIAILSTSQNPNAPVSFAPACALCLLFCIIQVLAVYLYKFFTIPEFKKESLEHQIVHVLANTIVVIPYSNWDQDEPPNLVLSVKQIKMNRRVKRKLKPASSSLKTHKRNRSHDFAQNFKKAHSRSKSDGAHKFPIVQEPQKPTIADSILPNFAELESKQNIQKELMKIWWDNPAKKLTADNAKEELAGYKMGKINVEDIEEVVRTLNEKGLINKKLFNPRRTKKEYFWLLVIQIILNLIAFGIEVAN